MKKLYLVSIEDYVLVLAESRKQANFIAETSVNHGELTPEYFAIPRPPDKCELEDWKDCCPFGEEGRRTVAQILEENPEVMQHEYEKGIIK